MAGTVSAAYKGGRVKRVIVDWLSDGSGDATFVIVLDGELVKVVTNPGTPAPDANYDITLVDEDSLDIAGSQLLNRHTTTTEVVYPFAEVTLLGTGSDAAARPICHYGPVTFTAAAAGSAKAGRATIYYR